MQEKYENNGGVVLALSNESHETVAKFMKGYIAQANKKEEKAEKGEKAEKSEAAEKEQKPPFKFNYVIGAGTGITMNTYAVKSYPTILVVDTKGKITYRGSSLGEVKSEIERLLKDDPPKDKSSLSESAAKALYKKAVGYAKKKKYVKALKAFEQCAEQFKGSAYGQKAAAKAQKIRSDKKIMAKINEGACDKECKNWLRLARSSAKAGQKSAAIEYYDKIIKKYPDSDFAKTARAEKAKL